MTLSPEMLRFISEYTTSLIGKINQVFTNRITTTFTNSNDVIPSSKLVKDEFAAVRSEMPTNTSDLTNDGADGTHVFIVEGDSRLTDTRNPKPHNQASSTITDTNTYSNIGNTLQNQASINSAINEKIGALMNLDIIEQVSTRPTASAETMNKIYLVPEATGATEDLFEVFVTVYENNAYKWEKIDTARIDISGKVDKVQGKQLSTEDFTSDEKSKLASIEPEATKTIVDTTITESSNNPVTSSAIYNGIYLNTTLIIDFTSNNNYGPFNKTYWIDKTIQEKYHSTVTKNPSQYTKQEYENQIGEQVDYDEIVDFIITAHPLTFKMDNPVIIIIDLESFENEPIKYMAVKNRGSNSSYLIRRLGSSSYIEKSSTQGLIKNDGTIDTNQYITEDNIPESFNYGYVDSNLVLHLICVDGEVRVLHSIIQSGDANTISAVITDKDNNPLGGVPVDFLFNGVKQGQSVNSDANGVSTYNYTGTGAGKVNIQVRVGSFQSEIYAVTDAKYRCYQNNISVSSNCQSTHTNELYNISLIDTSGYGFVYFSSNNTSSSWIYIEEGNTFEFEVTAITGTIVLRFDGSSANDSIITLSSVGKYRIEYNGTSTKVYKDNGLISTVNTSNESKQPRWRVQANSTISLKNILYY